MTNLELNLFIAACLAFRSDPIAEQEALELAREGLRRLRART